MYITNIIFTPPPPTLTSTCTYGILSFSVNNNNYNLLSTLFLRITRNEIASFSLPHPFLFLDRSLSRYFASFSQVNNGFDDCVLLELFESTLCLFCWSIEIDILIFLCWEEARNGFFFLFIPHHDLYFVPALY